MNKPVALVTGASRGIGRGIAVDLARTHTVIATYRGRKDAADSLQAETGAIPFQCDIASREDREAVMAFTIEKCGRLDLLVNNAGMAPRERRDILEATEESFDEVIATNLKGPHFLTQAAARWMEKQGSGRIVFITSISSYTASVNRGEYCISKAGLSMSVALYAQRLAAHGITVFEVRPGMIRTDMIAAVEQDVRRKDRQWAPAAAPDGRNVRYCQGCSRNRRWTLRLLNRTSVESGWWLSPS